MITRMMRNPRRGKQPTILRMIAKVGFFSRKLRGRAGGIPRDRICLGLVITTGKGSSDIGSLILIGSGLVVILLGRVLDLKSATGLVLGMASMSMLLLLLLLRNRGFGETLEKRKRKKSFAM